MNIVSNASKQVITVNHCEGVNTIGKVFAGLIIQVILEIFYEPDVVFGFADEGEIG